MQKLSFVTCLLLNTLLLTAYTTSQTEEEATHKQNVRAIYIANKAKTDEHLLEAMNTAKAVGANAIIIDIKDDFGDLTCNLPVEGASITQNPIQDIRKKLQFLRKHGFYTIARIVAFKDFRRNDLCIKQADGNVWTDKEKTQWLNPYDSRVTEYLMKISEETAKLGFDEIQYDYIRFSGYLKKSKISLTGDKNKRSKCDAINIFLKQACNMLHKIGKQVSVDVFGCIIDNATDPSAEVNSQILGQDYIQISKIADVICPMIYPSHFPKNSMNIKQPDIQPYETIYNALTLSEKMRDSCKGSKLAIVRPYLQAFTASWLKEHQKYTRKQIDEQIKATYDAGLCQWSLFNASGKYSNFVSKNKPSQNNDRQTNKS